MCSEKRPRSFAAHASQPASPMNIYGVCKVFRVPHNKHLIDPLHARYYYCLHDGARYQFTRWVASESETVTTFPGPRTTASLALRRYFSTFLFQQSAHYLRFLELGSQSKLNSLRFNFCSNVSRSELPTD